MSVEKLTDIFDYQAKEIFEFRLCADRFGDSGEKIYRLYCPYVIGYWEFNTLAALTESLLETNEAMQRGDQPEEIFSAKRGIRNMELKCSPRTWRINNMLHTKRGSFYSAYIALSPNGQEADGYITFMNNESHRLLHNEAFRTADSLNTILTDIEGIFASANSVQEQRQLFQRYRSRKKRESQNAGGMQNE